MRDIFICALIFYLLIPAGAYAEQTDIALSMCDLDTARSVAIASDLMDGAEAAGYTVKMENAEHRLSNQISDIDQLIEDTPRYLIIVAVKAVGLQKTIHAAVEKGIRVIIVDRIITDAMPGDVLCSVGMDSEWAGGECARILAGYFEGREAKILEIQGEAGASTTNGVAKGFRDALCDYENLQIGGVVSGDYSRETAQHALLKYYEQNGAGFDAVFGHSDEESLGAVGALFSLEELKDIPVVAIGGSDDARRALAAGKLLACVSVTPCFSEAVLDAIRADEAGESIDKTQLFRGEALYASKTAYTRGY